MDLKTLDLQGFAKRILELLGIDGGSVDIQIEKLADGSIRISREGVERPVKLHCAEE